MTPAPPAADRAVRRAPGTAALTAAAGAGLVLYAATRTWSLTVTARPGLSDLRTARTGVDAAGWLPALALVGLAGAGALLATRGRARRLLGALLAVVGLLLAAGAVAARSGLDPGAAGAGALLWPAACVLGGALVAAAGVRALRGGHRWAAMAARYERTPARPGRPAGTGAAGPGTTGPGEGAAGPGPAAQRPADTRAAWDALDRGDDPTAD